MAGGDDPISYNITNDTTLVYDGDQNDIPEVVKLLRAKVKKDEGVGKKTSTADIVKLIEEQIKPRRPLFRYRYIAVEERKEKGPEERNEKDVMVEVYRDTNPTWCTQP